MQPVSESFLLTLTSSHTYSTRLDLYASNVFIGSITGYVTDGSVTEEKQADIRRSFSATIVDPTLDLVPVAIDDTLTPYANEVRVFSGITGFDLLLLGTFRLTQNDVSEDSGAVTMSLAGKDRSWDIASNTFFTDGYYAVPGGLAFGGAIQSFLNGRFSLPFPLPVTPADFDLVPQQQSVNGVAPPSVTPAIGPFLIHQGEDPWRFARDMAATVGCDLYFTRDGTLTLVTEPDPTTAIPVASFTEGQTATFTSLKRGLTVEETFNMVQVTGIGSNLTGDAPTFTSQDNDQNSPTRVGGPFGSRLKQITNNMVVDAIAAKSSADAYLKKHLGIQENVSFPTMHQPHLDVDDAVTVTRARLGVTGVYLIDSITHPLNATEPTQMTLRERRVFT